MFTATSDRQSDCFKECSNDSVATLQDDAPVTEHR